MDVAPRPGLAPARPASAVGGDAASLPAAISRCSFWQPTTLDAAVSAALALHVRSYLSPNDMAAAATAAQTLGADHHFPAFDYRSDELPLDKALVLTDHRGGGGGGGGGGGVEAARGLIAAALVLLDGVVVTDRSRLVGPRSVLSLLDGGGGGGGTLDGGTSRGGGSTSAPPVVLGPGRVLDRQPLVYYLLNKPRRVMCTTRLGPHDRSAPTMLEYVPAVPRTFAVGRLTP